MIPTKRNDLVIGKIYADVDDIQTATYLKFEKRTREHLYFSYVCGEHTYIACENEDGLIEFENDNGMNEFYEPTL